MDDKNFGRKLFELRDYTPIPLLIVALVAKQPTIISATIGCLVVAMGEFLRIWSVSYIGAVSRTRSDVSGAGLVTDGPFSVVRNPLYVGNFFITLGISVFSGVFWVVLLSLIGFAVQYYYIVRYEESHLSGKFGETYRDYCSQVPAWIPRRLGYFNTVNYPDFVTALMSERRTFAAIVAVLLLMAI